MKFSAFIFLLLLSSCASQRVSNITLKSFVENKITIGEIKNPAIFENDFFIGNFDDNDIAMKLIEQYDYKNHLVIPKDSEVSKELWNGKYKDGLVIIIKPKNKLDVVLDKNEGLREIRFAKDGKFISSKQMRRCKNSNAIIIKNKYQNWDLIYLVN